MAASPCHDCASSYYLCSRLLFARRRQIGAAPMRHFRRHADALAQRGMRMDRLACGELGDREDRFGKGGNTTSIVGFCLFLLTGVANG